MNTTALLRQLDPPPLPKRTGICAAAVVADVDALAAEWSTGNDLSMISAKTVAQTNAEKVIVEAAVRILARGTQASVTTFERGRPRTTRAAGRALADALQAFQDEDPDALEAFAAEAAEWFRQAKGGA